MRQIGPVRAMDLSSDGTRLAAGGDHGVIHLLAIDTGDEIARFAGHDAPVMSLALSLDGKSIVSGSEDGLIRLFRVAQ